jgi:hypothetical protein
MKLAWIDAFKLGADVHTTGDVVSITHDFVSTLLANFEALYAKGYRVPLLRSHGRRDDYIYGDVHAMRVADGYVQCGVTFTREEEKQAFNEGLMREYSPGFDLDWLDPHTGEKLGPVLLELSFTALAYQRNLRAPQEANPVQMATYLHTFGDTMTRKKMMAEEEVVVEASTVEEMAEPTLTDIAAMLTQVLEMLAPKEEMMNKPEEEMSAHVGEDEEKKEMSARIRQLEERAVRAELSALGIKGEDDVKHLVQLSRQSPELYRATAKRLSRPVQSEIGVMGVAETSVRLDAASVAKAAKAAGATGPGRLALFLSANHPAFVNQINEVRKHL